MIPLAEAARDTGQMVVFATDVEFHPILHKTGDAEAKHGEANVASIGGVRRLGR